MKSQLIIKKMLWKKITLVTLVDKEENIKFYTEKCGFSIGTREMNGKGTALNNVLKEHEQ